MKPVIGIVARVEYPGDTGKFVVNDEYRKAIVEFGGNPFVILPPQNIDYGTTKLREAPTLNLEEEKMLASQLKMCDGILMPGGFKICNYDFFVLDYAIKNDIPILGICLGMQIMSNYKRDVCNEKNDPNGINHCVESGELVHFVDVLEESKLYSIIKKRHFKVNSFHKFHVLESSYYKTVSYSEDGLIEAVEYPGKRFNIGVQWHPERIYKIEEASSRLFKAFIEAAIFYRNNLKIYIC